MPGQEGCGWLEQRATPGPTRPAQEQAHGRGLGEQHRHAPAEWGELVALGGRDVLDQLLAGEPAQVIGGLPAGVGSVQQRADQVDQ